jgi:hypothetical protein
MDETLIAAPGAAAELPAPVETAEAPSEQPEVAEPETPEAEKPEDETSKALKRMERRISKLTAAKYQSAAEANQARQELEAIRQKLSQYEGGQEQTQQVRPEDVLTLAEQIAQQKIEQREVVNTVQSVLKAGRALDGFDDACNAVDSEIPFYTDKGQPTPFFRVVMESEQPARVLHYLGTNLNVAEELAGLTPTQQARRIARIEADLDGQAEPPAPKVSKAPKPIAPVKGTKADSGGLSDDLSMDEWARRFRERLRK